jgi:hypothetical protein
MMIGKGIAMAALIWATVYLEMHGKETSGLWTLIVIWIICGSWH